MTDEFVIQLNIADKIYKLRCKRAEEGILRKAAKQVNEMILRYRAAFPGSELELKDVLAMVACQLATVNLKNEEIKDVSPVFDKLEEMNLELEDYFRSNL